MLFRKKPYVYLQIFDRGIFYLALHPKKRKIIDKGKIVFDSSILKSKRIEERKLLEARLDGLVREKKWKRAKAHLLLMNDFVVIRQETVPAQLKRSEIKDYLDLHINESIALPYKEPVFAFDIVEVGKEEQKIVLIAYPGEYVKEYKGILEKASLKAEVADIKPLCLYLIAKEQNLIRDDEDAHTMLLHWNPSSLNMVVFNQDQPGFNRDYISEYAADAWEIDKNGQWLWLKSEPEKEMMLREMLNEIERFLSFYYFSVLESKNQITEIILTGQYPDLEKIKAIIQDRFNLKTKMIELPNNLEQSFAALYGLSLRVKQGKDIKKKQKSKDKKKNQKENKKKSKKTSQERENLEENNGKGDKEQ